MQKKSLSLFWKYSSAYKSKRFFAIFFPVLAVSVNAIAAPFVLSLFLTMLQHGHITLEKSWGLIALYAALIFGGEVVIWRLALYFTWTFEVAGQRDLFQAIFTKLAREDLNFHANRFGGSLVSQSTKLVSSFERFWDTIIWSIVPMITTVIGSVIILGVLGLWQYSLFLVLYTLVFFGAVLLGSRFLNDRSRAEASKANRMNGTLADMITNVTTVKAFGREDQEDIYARDVSGDWHTAATRMKWSVLATTSGFSSIYAIGTVGAFIFAVIAAQYGIVTVGKVYLVFIYALNINRQLWQFNDIVRTYNRIIGDSHEMTEILHHDYQLVDHTSDELKVSAGLVEFVEVSFAHDRGDGEQVFESFNLKIPAGQRVGVVGHSGSGKTTLTRILLRFSDIEKGSILIDGQDISQVTQQSLHESIAYIAQEPILFHRSLHDNIAYAVPEASRSAVEEAAKKAHAMEFINKLPDGFDTLVGERGVKLSGGQRQRIAIARAILKDAPILVMDEATSALDSVSEKLIQDSLGNLMKGRTSIVIAHRLSTIAKLDRIIVLEDGTIVEDGTHKELLANHAAYARLWSHQSGGFIEE